LIKEGSVDVLKDCLASLTALTSWDPESIDKALEEIAAKREIGMGKVGQPMRIAVTGSAMSPGIGDTCLLVGRDRTLSRIQKAIEHFGA
jgi:glutamyl-tRNA synthetase